MFSTRDPSGDELIDKPARLLLEAISATGPRAVEALKEWRSTVTLDDATYASHRILPMLADLIQREGIYDPDLARMRGVGRRYWVNNVLKFRLLFAALEALEAGGVRTMLLKGAALFARSAGTEGKRRSADYDFLVLPAELKVAGEILERRGFLPWGHSWRDLDDKLFDANGEGIGIVLQGYVGEIDLHWRPAWNIQDPQLAERFFVAAEQRTLRGHAVRVPSVTHHLFSAIARCEPWEKDESFARLVEGYVLLSRNCAAVDWRELAAMLARYGLSAPAIAYCDLIARHTEIRPPGGFIDGLKAGLSEPLRREWRIRGMLRETRTARQQLHLDWQDARFLRIKRQFPLPTRVEIWIRDLGNPLPVMGLAWRLARRRFAGASSSSLRFLEGFAFSEANGRWTSGKWALMTVPLNEAQRKGEPVRFNTRVYRGSASETRVIATGGRALFINVLVGDETDPNLELSVCPLAELGGDGLVLFWLPEACSPWGSGESKDSRELGLFVNKDWQASALDRRDRFLRINRRAARPGRVETWLRGLGNPLPVMGLAWRLARRRFAGASSSSLRFLEGFAFSEANGRWTSGKWALMTVPLNKAQRKGEPVRLNTRVYRGSAAETRVVATGGRELFVRVLVGDETDPNLELSVRPLAELGGDGLVLFWLPEACSPWGSGESSDRRELGLFVNKNWRAGAGS